MLAISESFPPWMFWSSIGLAASAAGIFIVGSLVQRKPSTVPAPPEIPLPPADAQAPPPPTIAVASSLAAQNAVAERRVGFRRVGNSIEVHVCDRVFAELPRRGWVLDRSRFGLRLSLIDKVPAGTILQVRPAKAPETAHWLPVEVRNAQQGEQSWEMGCKFVGEPPWEVLMLFG